MYATRNQGTSHSGGSGSKASGHAAGEGCDDGGSVDSAAAIVRSIVSVIGPRPRFDVRVGLRPHASVRPEMWIPRSHGGMIVGFSCLIFGVDGVKEFFRWVHGHESVFLESMLVEMRHLFSLCRKFPPGFVGDGMRELIVSELGPPRAWWIHARSVRLHW